MIKMEVSDKNWRQLFGKKSQRCVEEVFNEKRSGLRTKRWENSNTQWLKMEEKVLKGPVGQEENWDPVMSWETRRESD